MSKQAWSPLNQRTWDHFMIHGGLGFRIPKEEIRAIKKVNIMLAPIWFLVSLTLMCITFALA